MTAPAATHTEDGLDFFWNGFDYRQSGFDPEAFEDPHAFFEKYLWLRDKDDNLVRFRPKTIQDVYLAKKREAIAAGRKPWFLVLKSRQMGITTQEQGENVHMALTQKHKHILTMAHTARSTRIIFRMVNRFYSHIPVGLRPDRTQATTELNVPSLDSIIEVETAGGKSPAHGRTLSRVHLSEIARYELNHDDMCDLMAGVEEAAANGEIICETTAQGADGWFPETWEKAIKGDSDYTPIFLAWFDDPTNALLLDPGEVIIRTEDEDTASKALGPWTDEQVKYRRAKKRQAGHLFAQEFPETWESAFLTSGDSWFDQATVKARFHDCRIPVEERHGGELVIWHHPKPDEKYFIGADTAEGVEGGDYDAAGVLDSKGRQCARLYGKWRTDEYGRKLAALGRFYNMAHIAVEANNTGHSVLNTLQNVEHYESLFEHKAYDARPGAPGKLGWQTTAKTRPILLDMIRDEAVTDHMMEINDRLFLNECLAFVRNSTGKYEARSGKHDDLVIAWAIAWRVRDLAPGEMSVRWI